MKYEYKFVKQEAKLGFAQQKRLKMLRRNGMN